MHLIEKNTFLWLVILIIGVSNLSALNRSTYEKLLMVNAESVSSEDYNNDTDVFHSYIDEASILLRSTIINYYNQGYGDSTETYDYVSTIADTLSGRVVNYSAYSPNTEEPKFTYMFVLDRMNRVIQSKWCDPGLDGPYPRTHEIYRRYNSAGYVDSLLVRVIDGLYIYERLCKMFFDNENLTHSIVYNKVNNQWSPSFMHVFTYSQNPIILTNFVRWDTFFNQTNDAIGALIEAAYNPKVIPEDISSYERINGDWVISNYAQCSQSYSGLQANFLLTYESNTCNSTYSANSSGLIVRYHYTCYYPSGYERLTQNYYWDSIVANDDNTIPEVNPALCAYPNPFRGSTKISIGNESLAGAEIAIYNLRGQLVRSWKDLRTEDITWDGKDERSMEVPSGVYLIKYSKGSQAQVGKILRY